MTFAQLRAIGIAAVTSNGACSSRVLRRAPCYTGHLKLIVIAAVAIGGVKITGGSGSIVGVFLGCALLSCINVALTVLGIDADWQLLVYGATILIALIIDSVSQRRKATT